VREQGKIKPNIWEKNHRGQKNKKQDKNLKRQKQGVGDKTRKDPRSRRHKKHKCNQKKAETKENSRKKPLKVGIRTKRTLPRTASKGANREETDHNLKKFLLGEQGGKAQAKGGASEGKRKKEQKKSQREGRAARLGSTDTGLE